MEAQTCYAEAGSFKAGPFPHMQPSHINACHHCFENHYDPKLRFFFKKKQINISQMKSAIEQCQKPEFQIFTLFGSLTELP